MNHIELHKSLKIDCKNCFGFCCTALYFSKSDGFPQDKQAGSPCINLQSDFKCRIHNNLRKNGLKGCTAYDCFGAGQKVAMKIYKGMNWRDNPEKSGEMFEVFLIIRQIHEMMWYLSEALRIQQDKRVKKEIINMIDEMERLSELEIHLLIHLDLTSYRIKVNELLLKTSMFIRSKYKKGVKTSLKNSKMITGRLNLIGADLKNVSLAGEDLSGSLLIAADLKGKDLSGTDFLGADIRDTDFSGADLSEGIYLTQMQINSAKGNADTKLPISLSRPEQWIS